MLPVFHTLLLVFPAIVLFAVLLPLYYVLKKKKDGQAWLARALCTLVPVIFCLNGCLVNDYVGFWWLFAGQVLFLAGDAAVEKIPFAGLSAYIFGCLMNLNAFLVMAGTRLSIPGVWILLTLFVLFVIVFRLFPGNPDACLVPFLLYAAGTALAHSLTLPCAPGPLLMAGGAALLLLSALLSAQALIVHKPPVNMLLGYVPVREEDRKLRRSELFRLLCYYGGLYLIALAVWM